MTKNDLKWLNKISVKTNFFIELLNQKNGFYSYSLSGDLFDPAAHWGLGNNVFATKILHMTDNLSEINKQKLIPFIQSFNAKNGYYYDPLISKLTLKSRFIQSITSRSFKNISNIDTKRAETRQAWSALLLLDSQPHQAFSEIPYTSFQLTTYLESFNWSRPWHAGSHVSHLLFFLYYNMKLFNKEPKLTEKLIDEIFNWLQEINSERDGSWQSDCDSPTEKINGAMKILTGMNACNRLSLSYPEKLIDLCLETLSSDHACNHFNIVYVLYNCQLFTNHRRKDIEDFCKEQLEIYKAHYFTKYGGFSFNLNQSSQYYYGAKLTNGLNEPDIHGTVMFVWGISLINQILNLDLNLKIPLT